MTQKSLIYFVGLSQPSDGPSNLFKNIKNRIAVERVTKSRMSTEDVCQKLWVEFKERNKLRLLKQDENRRFGYFVNNHNFISNFNARKDTTHVCAHNKFSHMDDDEYMIHLAMRYEYQGARAPTLQRTIPHESIPNSLDYRDENIVCRVKNQGLSPNSWIFSALSAMECSFALRHRYPITFSEQQIIDCCDAVYEIYDSKIENIFEYVRANGIMYESLYPYIGVKRKSKFNLYNTVRIFQDYYSLEESESAIVSALYSVGPVSVAIDGSKNSFRFYKTGVYFDPTAVCQFTCAKQALLCIGYDNQDGQHWVLKNSWGKDWGEGGYVRLHRNGQGYAGITQLASVPEV